MKAERPIANDCLKTIAQAKMCLVKTQLLVTAYHEAGHLLGYLASDFTVPDDGGVGIVGDRFKFRRRGTLGGFKGYAMGAHSCAGFILTALESENVGNFDVRGQTSTVITRTELDTDFDQLELLRGQLGKATFGHCRVRSWIIVQDNLHFLRAAAHQLFKHRQLDATAIDELEDQHPLKSFFCTTAPPHVPAGKVSPRPIGLGWKPNRFRRFRHDFLRYIKELHHRKKKGPVI